MLEGVAKPEKIIGAEHPLHYRNKITATFGRNKQGVILGLYEEKSHRVVQNEGCLIEDERAEVILATLKKLVESFKLTVYSEVSGYGLLKHVQIRTSRSTGEIMVILVCAGPVFPSKNNFAKALKTAHPEITTLVLNINDKDTTMVLGERNITVFGPGFIEDVLCGNRYRISPGSFYQVNPGQTKVLYETAVEFAGLSGREHVVDAYCGTGTIALTAAGKCGRVTGVELNRTAVKDAIRNAKANNIENALFIADDAGRYLSECAKSGEKPDIIFMDPPRSGSTEEFIKACVRISPSRIVYVSCEPTTLARDLKLFKKHGYIAQKCVGVDMFPQTENIETVCLLSKLSEAKHHISVQVDMDELDVTAAESKATYEEIQEWVQEKYGFHVTHLNIAKTKRKCGIIERQNYNLPKNKYSRSPETPKEKEEAIIEAFKAFRMI